MLTIRRKRHRIGASHRPLSTTAGTSSLYHLTDSERKQAGIESLPASLGEALAVTEQSELVRQTLGDHAFERFIEVKKWEWDEFRVQVTEWELQKFLPIL